MPRRNLLTPAERAALLAFPTSDDELTQHCTCSEPDLSVIRQGHSGQIRLGIAVQLCDLRYPGFALLIDAAPRGCLLSISVASCASSRTSVRSTRRGRNPGVST